jgi:poly[(R)-3-hydroxyalkanoate] polymerase subunit PhaC
MTYTQGLMASYMSLADSWLEAMLQMQGAMLREFGVGAPDPSPVTPYEVVYQGGKLSLRHYRAAGPACSTPILLVCPLIKRPLVLDFQPGRSVIEDLTRQGFEVFLTDWIPPTAGDDWRGFDAYVNQDLAQAVRAVQGRCGVEQVTLLGYDLGSLLGVIHAALHPGDVKNLVTLTVPLDMSIRDLPAHDLIDWLDGQALQSLSAFYRNSPAWLLSAIFSGAVSMQRMLSKYMGPEQCDELGRYASTFPAFRQWLERDVPIAGTLFQELTSDIFRKNLLARGGFKVGSTVVDLKHIGSPLLNVVGQFDVIVHPHSSLPLADLAGGTDKNNLLFPSGHLGVVLGAEVHRKLWPRIGSWLKAHDN